MATTYDYPTTELGMLRAALAEQSAEGAPEALLELLRAAIAKREGRPTAADPATAARRPATTTAAAQPASDYTNQIKFFEKLLATRVAPAEHAAYRDRVGNDPRVRSRVIDELLDLPDLTPPQEDKQLKYLDSLIARKVSADLQAKMRERIPADRAGRSKLIDMLLGCRDVVAPTALEEGMYSRDGDVYKVQRTRDGRFLYAKILDRETGKYDRAPGATKFLTAAHRMTVDEVTALSRDLERCCICSTKLTRQESIDRGIGPICAAKV
jgi:hypothetical protein